MIKQKLRKQRSKFQKELIQFFYGLLLFGPIVIWVGDLAHASGSSMEATSFDGDWIIKNKISYGIRLWNYKSNPFTSIRRNDLISYYCYDRDTLVVEDPNQSYYRYLAAFGREATHKDYTIKAQAIRRRQKVNKRCVAIAGDTLQLISGITYVNGKIQQHKNLQHGYEVQYKTDTSHIDTLYLTESKRFELEQDSSLYKIRRLYNISQSTRINIYPLDTAYNHWNTDDYGPVWVPKKGVAINLTKENLILYSRIIVSYEKNLLETNGNRIYINGVESNTYTFKQNYYWVMGDNRHDSTDSRHYGFLPEDHIIGKELFVLFSIDMSGGFPHFRHDRWFKKLE